MRCRKAFNRIVTYDKLKAFSKTIPFNHYSWTTREDINGKGEVFIICNELDAEEVLSRIKSWAMKEPRLKESLLLTASLANEDGVQRNCGWLELDNGFLFFTDKEMFDKAAALFCEEAQASA